MTTIDHAAEARKLIEDAYADDPALLNGIKAVAHAQLAFVEAQREANEQARIANLIALSQATDGYGWQAKEPLNAIYGYRHETYGWEDEGLHIRDDIKKGLGL